MFQMERLEQQLVLERELSVDRLKTIKLLEEQPPGDMVMRVGGVFAECEWVESSRSESGCSPHGIESVCGV